MARPNIVFIFSDQQRWDTVGCYGQRLPLTPNLDRMAAEGVRFDNAFTCQPVCGPARACLQTGKYATEVGCHTNHRRLPPDEKTVPMYLREKGRQRFCRPRTDSEPGAVGLVEPRAYHDRTEIRARQALPWGPNNQVE